MNNRIKNDIKIVLDYLWRDKKNHYQSGPFKKHIFLALKRLTKEIEYHTN